MFTRLKPFVGFKILRLQTDEFWLMTNRWINLSFKGQMLEFISCIDTCILDTCILDTCILDTWQVLASPFIDLRQSSIDFINLTGIKPNQSFFVMDILSFEQCEIHLWPQVTWHLLQSVFLFWNQKNRFFKQERSPLHMSYTCF